MKILKYLLGIILLLILLFIAMGFIRSTIEYDCEVTIDKPASEVWAVMNDESTLSEWISGYESSEVVSGTPNTVGAVSNININENGQKMTMQETITAVIPEKQLSMDFSMDMMDMNYDLLLESKGNSTVVKTTSKTEGNGMLYRSILAFMPSAMEAQELENLNKLKRLVEENTKE